MDSGAKIGGCLIGAPLAVCAIFSASFFAPLFAQSNNGHISAVLDDAGRRFFVNAEPPAKINLTAPKSRPNIYLPAESSFTGHSRPAVEMSRDGGDKTVLEAYSRPSRHPPLLR